MILHEWGAALKRYHWIICLFLFKPLSSLAYLLFISGAVLFLGIVLVTKPSFLFTTDYCHYKENSSSFPNASEFRINHVRNGEIQSLNGQG